MSTALLSLPRARAKDVTYSLTVPTHLRVRAGQQVREAVRLGRIAPQEVADAVAAGDEGISALMCRHHVLRHDVSLPTFDTPTTLDAGAVEHIVAWARHLRSATRLDNSMLSQVPRERAFDGLLDVCIAASAPALAAAPAPSDDLRHRFYAVYSSFAERILHGQYEGASRQDTPDDTLTITVEPLVIPLVNLPEVAAGDDRAALHSALHALSAAESLGLWIPPRDVHHVLDGWFVELLADAVREATKRPDGSPIITVAQIEQMAEEIGLDVESDPEGTCRNLEAHHAHLQALNAVPVWKPNTKAMKAWLRANQGSDLHELVTRLLAIAARLGALDFRAHTYEVDYEGDSLGMLVLAPTASDLHMFDTALEQYGQNDTPQMLLRVADGARNASAFWKLHDDVVMAVSLVSEAANAILTYEKRLEQSR